VEASCFAGFSLAVAGLDLDRGPVDCNDDGVRGPESDPSPFVFHIFLC
jgi:hypothetical protein